MLERTGPLRRYVVTVATDWSPATGDHEYGHVGLDLVEAVPRDSDVAGPAPSFLRHASELFVVLGNEMLAVGRVLRVDAPRSATLAGPWPWICDNADSWDRNVHRLLSRLDEPAFKELYPLSVWGISRQQFRECVRTIEAFRALPWDDGLLGEIAAMDVFRLSLFESSVTVAVPRDHQETVVAWIRGAAGRMKVQLDWDTYS
jgi:hypothetical protein